MHLYGVCERKTRDGECMKLNGGETVTECVSVA